MIIRNYLLSLLQLFWNKNKFILVQFVNTFTTSYWYISRAHYKIQDVSIFSPRSNNQAFQGFLLTHSLLLHPVCLFLVNNHSDNETYEIMAALNLQQDLICYSFNQNWKKPLKSSIKVLRIEKILKPCKRNWAYTNCWMGHEGVDTN